MRSLRLGLYFLLFTSFAFAQNSLPVTFLQAPSRNSHIGKFTRNGMTYGSLDDLARVFVIDTYADSDAAKMELRTEAYTITASAGNPFIVLTDLQHNSNVVQMPAEVRFAAGSYFVPLESFIPILDYISPEAIAFDRVRTAVIVGTVTPVSRFDVTGVDFEQKTNGYLVKIHCAKNLPDYETFLKIDGDDTWLYVTIADARADEAAFKRIRPSGFVKKIMVFQSPTSVQLTIRIKGQMDSHEPIASPGSNDIFVAIRPSTEEQSAKYKEREYQHNLERERKRWKLDVVVIDAGHGGKDPGTIGVTKTKEKDVTLAIALKLGKLLEKQLPGVRVVYTRKTDEFIELYRRGQIANESGGKLFVSIHCNAMPRKPRSTSGFEIYLLRPGKTEKAISIAERENAVVKMEEGYEQRYKELTEDNFILMTMAQSAYVKYSEQFADILRQEMGKRLDLDNNGTKQAGFYVLVGASMPNVLVETGYLSNTHDEKILKSTKGQQKIAESIFYGIKKYKTDYERSLQEGASIGSTR
ncbi:MAG TPA: N-acetylmuramoyl-L-alanine amidase [Bacteroidota bacterium]|jgi:N-acetylmuramoyl-L-alanine amidase|nr:N-acetylmuramoyl-L-alanine amidase [Bacteroidota bacterium]